MPERATDDTSVPFSYQILLVEDEPVYVQLVEHCLLSATTPVFSLGTADTLQKGLELLASQKWDVVLLDLNLPDSLGLDTVRAVRGAAPATAIVVLTATDDELTAQLMLRAGAQDFLSKGDANPRALRRSVLYSIERKRAELELISSREKLRLAEQDQQALEELRRSEALHRTIVEDQTEFILRLSLSLEITYANTPFCAFAGETPQALTGRSFLHFVSKEEHGALAGTLRALEGEGPPTAVEYTIRSGSGRTCRALWTCRAITAPDGRLLCYQQVGSDVTLLRSAQSALARTEQRLEMVISQIPALLWTTDRDLVLTSVVGRGPGTMGPEGRAPEELVGTPLADIFRDNEREGAVVEAHRQACSRGGHGEFFLEWEGRHFSARVESLYRKNRIAGTIGIALDVTEQLQSELEQRRLRDELYAREKLAAIGHAMANVGHCMKNMLTGLKGGVFLLDRALEEFRDPRLAEAQILLSRSTARINLLLLNMLDLSRTRDSGTVATAVGELLDETVRTLQAGLQVDRDGEREGAVEIQALIEEEVRTFPLDPERLYRVLLNLGLNAVDAMPDGGQLLLEAGAASADEVAHALDDGTRDPDPAWRFAAARHSRVAPVRHLRLDITDTGEGIGADHLEQLFRPFFSTKWSKGTGLGLAAVRQFVDEHGGHILVRTALRRGTRFTILLPEPPECEDDDQETAEGCNDMEEKDYVSEA